MWHLCHIFLPVFPSFRASPFDVTLLAILPWLLVVISPHLLPITNLLIQYPARTSLQTPRRFYLHLPSKCATDDSPEDVNNEAPTLPLSVPQNIPKCPTGWNWLVWESPLALPLPPLMFPVTSPLSSTSNSRPTARFSPFSSWTRT